MKLDLTTGLKYRIGDKFQQTPLFEIVVDFRDLEIFFAPSRFEIRDAIKNAITDGVNTVCKYELFLNQPEFEVYMNA